MIPLAIARFSRPIGVSLTAYLAAVILFAATRAVGVTPEGQIILSFVGFVSILVLGGGALGLPHAWQQPLAKVAIGASFFVALVVSTEARAGGADEWATVSTLVSLAILATGRAIAWIIDGLVVISTDVVDSSRR